MNALLAALILILAPICALCLIAVLFGNRPLTRPRRSPDAITGRLA